MKKLLLLLFVPLSFLKINSQVVFCPPGAEWHYEFYNNLPYYIMNENIKYIKDSTLNGTSTKVLQHKRYYNQLNNYSGTVYTFLKQNGDTIFFKNPITQNNWQVLYNFNATVNHGWSNHISRVPYSTYTNMYTTTVDSINTININGNNLKQLFVTNIYYVDSIHTFTSSGIIVERIGYTNGFLFNFYSNQFSDGDYFDEILCYNDNTLGLKQFSAQSCLTGIQGSSTDKNLFQFFPNPCSDKLNISLEDQHSSSEFEIRIVDLPGREILRENNFSNSTQSKQIDMSAFKSGIYFVQLYENKKLIETRKLIKD